MTVATTSPEPPPLQVMSMTKLRISGSASASFMASTSPASESAGLSPSPLKYFLQLSKSAMKLSKLYTTVSPCLRCLSLPQTSYLAMGMFVLMLSLSTIAELRPFRSRCRDCIHENILSTSKPNASCNSPMLEAKLMCPPS